MQGRHQNDVIRPGPSILSARKKHRCLAAIRYDKEHLANCSFESIASQGKHSKGALQEPNLVISEFYKEFFKKWGFGTSFSGCFFILSCKERLLFPVLSRFFQFRLEQLGQITFLLQHLRLFCCFHRFKSWMIQPKWLTFTTFPYHLPYLPLSPRTFFRVPG